MRELTCLAVCVVAAVAVVTWNVDRRSVAIEQDGISAEIGVAPSVSVTATIRNQTPGVQRIRAWWYVQPPQSEQPWIDYNYMSQVIERDLGPYDSAELRWTELPPPSGPDRAVSLWVHHQVGDHFEHADGVRVTRSLGTLLSIDSARASR